MPTTVTKTGLSSRMTMDMLSLVYEVSLYTLYSAIQLDEWVACSNIWHGARLGVMIASK